MAPRILLNDAALPGVRTEHVRARDGELARCRVYDPDGTYVGIIVHVGRRVPAGTEYGWKPAAPGYWGLTSKVDAARKTLDLVNL